VEICPLSLTFHQLGICHQGIPEKQKRKNVQEQNKEGNQLDQIIESSTEPSQTAEIWKGAIC
jgi:hypothetical protein